MHCFGYCSHQLPMELKYQGFFLAMNFMHRYERVQIRYTIRVTYLSLLWWKATGSICFQKMIDILIWPIPPYLETHFTVSHIELLTISVLIQDWLKCITVFFVWIQFLEFCMSSWYWSCEKWFFKIIILWFCQQKLIIKSNNNYFNTSTILINKTIYKTIF